MIKNDLAIFEDHKIRRIYDKKTDTWFFSVIDVVGALTDSTNPRRYWSDLKKQIAEQEGFSELYEKIVQLKLKAPDGKMRETDCANTESLFRIIQSIPSPKAEPFKLWLAKIGYERIQEIADPERSLNITRDNRSKQGCTYDDIPDFYKVYCERELVSLYTAHMLWLDINPDGFDDQEEYHRYLRERGLYQEAIEITIKIQHTTKDSKELEIISTALAFSPKMQHTIENNIFYDANGIPIVHSVNLLKFVLWTEKKNYRRPFPKKLAIMIKEFHNVVDFRLENERLKAKNIKLEDELKIPNGKRLTTYQKLVMAALAKAYGKESLIQSFRTADNPISNKEVDKSTNTKLTYNKLTQELNDAIGFNLNQETIKEVIEDSIKHIPKVKK